MESSVCSERTEDFDPYDPNPVNHIGLAVKMAAPIARAMRQETLDSEAFSDALYGLFEASRCYDVSKGVRFVTYAFHSVKHAISKGIDKRTQRKRVGFNQVKTTALIDDIGEWETEPISPDVIDMIPDVMEACLNERELEIVRMKLAGQRFEDIGDHFGFSKQRAEQIMSRAIKKLREEFEARGVTEL